MLLFLDFDGVLRPVSSPPLKFDSKCLALFEGAILGLSRWEIAITSSWRDLETLSEIRSRFSPPVAMRIVGAVPTVVDGSDYPRHREVLEFLYQRGRTRERWIGIEDDPRAYPPNCRVVLTNPAVGFDESAGYRLRKMAVDPGRERP